MDLLIRTLVRFQELNLDIARANARLAQIPADLTAINKEQERASASITHARERMAEAQKRRRDSERDLTDLEGKISKYNDQSREVKTNEQYRAIMSEIQNVKARVGEVEEKVLLAMEEVDECERRIREDEKAVAARRPEFDGRRAALAAESARLTAEADRLTGERDELRGQIDSSAMDVYDRTAGPRGGVAMARARDERCMGCNVRLRPQVFADVRKNDQIIQCDSCKRILYYVEEPLAAGEGSSPEGIQGEPPADGSAPPPPSV